MDITPAATKSPETESTETAAATKVLPAKHLSFTNGVLKRHQGLHHHHHHHHGGGGHHHHHHHQPIVITYKECLKNHAASLGGHALDGCGEFMPSPTATSTDPTSLKCAACGCHRNFHRREPDDPSSFAVATPHGIANPNTITTATIEYQPLHRHHPSPPPSSQALHPPQRSPSSSSPPPISSSYYPSAPQMLLALSGNLRGHENVMTNVGNVGASSRKRFRTKFSQSQKERMFEFAESVGWKMQKRDDEMVQTFCNDVGIDRTVLKVWMHNNKNTFLKKENLGGEKINLERNGNNGGGEEGDENNFGTTTTTENNNVYIKSENIAHVASGGGVGGGGGGARANGSSSSS